MSFGVGDIVDVLKSSTEVLLGFFIGSGAVLLLGNKELSFLGFGGLGWSRPWLGLAFVVSGSALAARVLSAAAKAIRGWATSVTRRRRAMRSLPDLGLEEQRVLRVFIDERTMSHGFSKGDGRPAVLARLGFLRRMDGLEDAARPAVYEMEGWAWKYFRGHPEIVNGFAKPNPAPGPSRRPPSNWVKGY